MVKDKFFIILSNQPYDGPYRTNKHYIAEELERLGFKVIFVDPPTRFKFLKSLLKKRKIELVSKKSPNFYVYYAPNILNFIPFSLINNIFHKYIIYKILKSLNYSSKNSKLVMWVYHFDFPQLFQFKKLIKPNIFIYDVVDNYEEFPEYSQMDSTNKGLVKVIQKVDSYFKTKLDQKGLFGKNWVRYQENKLAKQADLMFASHPLLYDKFKKINNNIFYTPNAGQFDFFNKKPDKNNPILQKIKKPSVLYSGALDNYKFNVELLEYAAKKLPNVNFALVGPVKLSDSNESINKLKKYPNIIFTGPIKYAESFAYFFDVYIIPYRINNYTYYGCFPIKLFNALSTGIPVVVTDLPAYRGLNKYLYISKTKESFVQNITKALNEKDKNIIIARKNLASKNTWKNKVKNQLNAINNFE